MHTSTTCICSSDCIKILKVAHCWWGFKNYFLQAAVKSLFERWIYGSRNRFKSQTFTFPPSLVLELKILAKQAERLQYVNNQSVTAGGQNNWSFCGRHESLDGCKETNVILKYDVNLLEQEKLQKSGPRGAWMGDLYPTCLTSSNRMSEVAVFLLCGTVWSRSRSVLAFSFFTADFPNGEMAEKCKRSAFCFVLK